MKENPKIVVLLRQVFEKHQEQLCGYRIFRFGSSTTGCTRNRSDFDISLLSDRSLPLGDFYAIGDDIDTLPTRFR